LPTISAKVKELFGLDLDAYLRAAHASKPEPKRLAGKRAAKKGAAKKGAAKKGAAKKGGARR
ncbi:MAG TPA: hypothetical protein VF621_17510, partial [Pyrinomonadaceae bacterium]